jgi:L-ascorbate metabolism protein UlaG (beta-lactamase superfamily)
LFEYGGVKIIWLGHDGFKIKNAKTVYVDPYEIKGGEKADILLPATITRTIAASKMSRR